MVVTVFCRFYYHLPPLAEDAVRTPRSVAEYFDFLKRFRQVEDVLMSISRPDCGTFQENKNKENLFFPLNLPDAKAIISRYYSPFLLFNEIIITNFQNVLIFAEKFDIIKPTGENNDFNV